MEKPDNGVDDDCDGEVDELPSVGCPASPPAAAASDGVVAYGRQTWVNVTFYGAPIGAFAAYILWRRRRVNGSNP